MGADGNIERWDGSEIETIDKENTIGVIKSLPAVDQMEAFIEAIRKYSIVIVEGDTGSGKSTQIPQYIYEWMKRDNLLKDNVGLDNVSQLITQTQPRRSAAMGVAGRIDYEHACLTENGMKQFSGFRTGKGNNIQNDISVPLTVQTAGYTLASYASAQKMPNVLMLDEFHLGDPHTNILAHLALEQLRTGNDNTKLIISSATLNKDALITYLKQFTDDHIPVVSIEGRTFPIEEKQCEEDEFMGEFQKSYATGDNILIFEDGKTSIKETIEQLKDQVDDSTIILPFHSEISSEEQQKIIHFNAEEGKQIIIVATNAAQESLTVPYIDTVLDKGYCKQASVDENGVPVLTKVPCSKVDCTQRKGRVGRVKPGNYIRFNKHSIDGLPEFPQAQMSNMTLGKEILFYANLGRDLRRLIELDKKKGIQTLIDMPDENLLNLSYERLFNIGALDENNNITEVGKDILSFPLSEFNAKVLLESIDKDVSLDMLEVVSILENDGFLMGSGSWKDLYEEEKKINKNSDIFFQLKLLRIFLSRDLDNTTLNYLGKEGGLGFEWRKQYLSGEKMLFECVEEEVLEVFGIKKNSLESIFETITELEERLNKKGVDLSNNGTQDDKIISLLLGYPHHIFRYNDNEKKLENAVLDWNTEGFESSNTSIVQPSRNNNDGKLYLGTPFIIGGVAEGGCKDPNDDRPIMSNLQLIEEKHLEAANDDKKRKDKAVVGKYRGMKNNKKRTSESNTSGFGVTDKKIESTGNTNKSNSSNLTKTLRISGESGDNKGNGGGNDHVVARVKVLPSDGEVLSGNRSNILQEFTKNYGEAPNVGNEEISELDILTSELLEITTRVKNITPNLSEINILEKALSIIMNDIEGSSNYKNLMSWIGNLDHKQVVNFKIDLENLKNDREKIIKLKKNHSWIESFLADISSIVQGDIENISVVGMKTVAPEGIIMTDPNIQQAAFLSDLHIQKALYLSIKKSFRNTKIINQDEAMGGKILGTLQKLYGFDKKAYKKSNRKIDESIIYFEDLYKQYNSLEYRKTIDKNESRQLHLNLIKLKDLIRNLTVFLENSEKMNNEISKIDFSDVLFSPMEKSHSVFTKKYLYNTLTDIVFNGDTLSQYNQADTKFIRKIQRNLGDVFSGEEIGKLITSLKIIQLKGSSEELDSHKPLLFLKEIRDKVEVKMKEYKKEYNGITNNIETIEESGYNLVLNEIKGILENYFSDDYLEQKCGKIGKVVHSIIIGLDVPVDGVKIKDSKSGKNYSRLGKKISSLFTSLGLPHSEQLHDYFIKLDDYTYLRETITDYLGLQFHEEIKKNPANEEELLEKITVARDSEKELLELAKYFNDTDLYTLLNLAKS